MNKIKVEYLLTLKSSDNFCKNTDAFNNLLQSNSDIKIEDDSIKYKKIDVGYRIKTGELASKNQRFFEIQFSVKNQDDILEFVEFLKVVRSILYKTDGNLNTLWDDISLIFSQKAYPHINEIENLLRKLITKFMLTNVGIDWVDETIPQEIKSVLKNKKKERNGYTNILHETDFIHLADFMFKPYQTKNTSELFDLIKKESRVSKSCLKEFLPKSNWERYFSNIVDCEDGYFNKRWEKLYELRCLVAHNNFITKNQLDEVIKLSEDLKEKFKTAINSLDKVIIPEKEKENLVENAVSSLNESYGEFINQWKVFEKHLRDLLVFVDLEKGELKKPGTTNHIIRLLNKHDVLSKEFTHEISYTMQFRNHLLHHTDILYTEDEISFRIKHLKKIITQLNLIKEKLEK